MGVVAEPATASGGGRRNQAWGFQFEGRSCGGKGVEEGGFGLGDEWRKEGGGRRIPGRVEEGGFGLGDGLGMASVVVRGNKVLSLNLKS